MACRERITINIRERERKVVDILESYINQIKTLRKYFHSKQTQLHKQGKYKLHSLKFSQNRNIVTDTQIAEDRLKMKIDN